MDHDGAVSTSDLYEHAACGLLSTLSDGTIARINHTLCRWLEQSADAIVGKKRFQDLLSVGSKIFHQTHWMPLLQVQGSVAEVQFEMMRPDGRPLPVLVNAVKRATAEGTHHDIAIFVATDRKAYERELRKARRLAEELLESERKAQEAVQNMLREKERDAQERALLAEQLVGIVSHDLRTPLGAILLGAHILGTGELAAAQTRIVTRIASAGNRANRMIQDLLDFTQARLGGGLRITRADLDLHALVADVVEELKLAWPGRLLEHVTQGDGAGRGDADRLSQVVTNLASNALTYGTPGEPVVISTYVRDAEMILRVHNPGAPIAPELVPHLFEPLRRGEHQIKQGLRSLGLGLYIVQQIVNAHAGHVSVTSTEAEGTTFTVTLPST